MFKNNLKIAWRSLKTNRLFSAINIFGLSIGLAVTFTLFIFIRHEQSFDSMYSHEDRIQRVLLHSEEENGQETWSTAPPVLAKALMAEVPDVAYAARMLKNDFGGTASVRAAEQNYTENSFYWVDKELLQIFDIPFVAGQAQGALDKPNTVVISETIAKKYFGSIDVIGKMIAVDGRYTLEVTGVYKDFPNNSSLEADVLAASSTMWFYKNDSWNNASFETYCLLKPNTSGVSAETQITEVLNKYVTKQDQWYSLSLQPLSQIHLYSASFNSMYISRIGDIQEIRNLSYLALLILLIACINYMNLTTARSQKRAKEVGISKTLGSSASRLVFRFYSETALITFISIVVGVFLCVLMLPLFNALAGQDLHTGLLLKSDFLLTVGAIWVLVTIVAGSYPALYLSKFSPSTVLKGRYVKGKSNEFVRRGLVVMQFSASIILIVGVLVIAEQIQFIKNKKLGFNPENVIAISTSGIKGNKKADALVSELKSLGNVSAISMAQGFPGMEVSGRTLRKNENDENGLNIQTNVTDESVVEALQLKLLAGRSLPKVKSSKDTIVEVILNKKAIDYLGFTPDEAIGKKVIIGAPNIIVGVVDNFNFASLHQPIGAYAFHNNVGDQKSYALVRYGIKNPGEALKQFEAVFKKVLPEVAFGYSFLDNNIEKLYLKERRAAQMGITFSMLAICIACLGLFGLAAYTAEQRKKEIGVRKVLGASVMGITQMLSKDFLKLVLVSVIIAFPIAFWLMNNWLQDFAYRITIGWTVFAIAGILALAIALFTVSFQAIKAALANPVKSLRTE